MLNENAKILEISDRDYFLISPNAPQTPIKAIETLHTSMPTGSALISSIIIPPDYQTPLSVRLVPELETNVTIDGEESTANWLETQILTMQTEMPVDPDKPIALVIQIEGTRVDDITNDKLLRKLTVTSDVYHTTTRDIFAHFTTFLAFLSAWIQELIEKEGHSQYQRFFTESYGLHSITRLVITRFVKQNGGGCAFAFESLPIPPSFAKHRIASYAVGHNLCFYACLVACLGNNCQDIEKLEKEALDARRLICTSDALVDFDEVILASNYYNINIEIWEITTCTSKKYSHEFIKTFENQKGYSITLYLLLKQAHYYHILNYNLLNHRRCINCMKWRQKSSKKHWDTCQMCPTCHRKKTKNHVCQPSLKRKKSSTLTHNKKLKNTYISDKHVWFADLETFTDNERMTVYSSAIVSIDHIKNYESQEIQLADVECAKYYGPGGFNLFCLDILNLQGTVIFYNGSRFDLYFILEWLICHQIPIKKFMRDDKSNRILSIEVQHVRFWDLCLFTMGSLQQACKDLRVPSEYQKKDFDHTLINSWETAHQHKDLVIPYNQYDVIALGIAYYNFSRAIFKLYNFNCIEAITLSNMAYEIWRNQYIPASYLSKVVLPNTDEYNFMRRGLFGGRCCPQRQLFLSSQYENYISGNLNHCDITDYLVYLDVVSLYPYSCIIGRFPVGHAKYLAESEFFQYKYYLNDSLPNNNKCTVLEEAILKSFFEVDVQCPKTLLTPFLFEKGQHGELIQSLQDKTRQVYDGYSLIEASLLGYKIKNIHAILQYSELSNCLHKYMEHAFDQKSKSAKGSIDYACHKYLMNGLTGKFNQIKRDIEWSIIYNDREINESLQQIAKFEWLLDEEGTIKGALIGKHEEREPTKPLQFGVNILSTSRVLMSIYTRHIGGYTDPSKASFYGDTDSMILHSEAYKDAKNRDTSKTIFGDEFGRLSEEWKDGKILRAVFIAPKTYILEILKSDGKLIWHMAAKGIPQPVREIEVDEYYQNHNKECDTGHQDLKTIIYCLFDSNDQLLATRNMLNWDFYYKMAHGGYVICHFGSIKRRIADASRGNIPTSITLLLNQERSINYEKWWLSQKRSYSLQNISYPLGHNHY